MDDCPSCGGVWLDVGGLVAIRNQFKTEAERKQAAEQYLSKLFSKEFEAAAAKQQASLEKTQKFARALRFVCPSYWIPGKKNGEPFESKGFLMSVV